jgi:luciferase family oxidoreductase group 1
MNFPLSVLDLSPVSRGEGEAKALQNTLDLARKCDVLGYTRYWLAEHHNISSVASTAPEIMIAHVSQVTERMRVGSGGIMLPNHSALRIAETFRVLEALHPGRIDLGIGRAPGSDPITALALRRSRDKLGPDEFPEQLNELINFSGAGFPTRHPFSSIRAIPTDVPLPPIWILGSSGDGARIAGELGVGFAFAHHFSPDWTIPAIEIYRETFRASSRLDRPRVIVTASAVCAKSDAEAERLAASAELGFVWLRSGQPRALIPADEASAYTYSADERLLLSAARRMRYAGSPQTVRRSLKSLVGQTGADEVMITTMVYDQADRVRSYVLLAEEFELGISS